MDVGSIKEAILKDGFVVIEASDVGQRVDDFTRKKYPFRAEGGLFFLKDTLSDSTVVGTVESLFERSGLGMFKGFGPHPDTARTLLNKTSDELLVLNVLHCGPASKIILYENTQRHFLNAAPPSNKEDDTGLLELSSALITKIPGITATEKVLPDGGFIFLDGRFFTTILEGMVIEVAFAVEKELKEWHPIELLESPTLRGILDTMNREMNRERIVVNIILVKELGPVQV